MALLLNRRHRPSAIRVLESLSPSPRLGIWVFSGGVRVPPDPSGSLRTSRDAIVRRENSPQVGNLPKKPFMAFEIAWVPPEARWCLLLFYPAFERRYGPPTELVKNSGECSPTNNDLSRSHESSRINAHLHRYRIKGNFSSLGVPAPLSLCAFILKIRVIRWISVFASETILI